MINRGNYRRDLFAVRSTRESFEGCLFEAAERFDWRLHAYVVMRNHFHLAVETQDPNLSTGMQWLQSTWATRFNRFRRETGRPFQGRYKAIHVEPGHALAQVAHYIHLNPVAANVVPSGRLLEFSSSSLPKFVGKSRPKCLSAETVLGESGGLADTAAGWRRYVAYLGVLAEKDIKLREEKFGKLSRGWAIGTADFRQEIKTALAALAKGKNRFVVLGTDRAAHSELRAEIWEEKLTEAAKALDVSLTNLGPRKSAPAKVLLAALLKGATSVSNGWLAQRLGMGEPASVSQFVRRFRLGGGTESRAFKVALSRVKA